MNAKSVSNDYFITLDEFARRIQYGKTTARDIAYSKILCDAGISVRANPLKQNGGIRINWPLYVEFVKTRPAVAEHRNSKMEMRP